MKKEYISPDIKIKEINMQSAMMAASEPTGEPSTDIKNELGTQSVGGGAALSKPNSIWDDEE